MNKYLIIFVLYILFCPVSPAALCGAAEFGSVKGYVFDAKTNAGMEYANIIVLNTELGAVSEKNGYFIIQRVPAGNHYIKFSFISQETSLSVIALRIFSKFFRSGSNWDVYILWISDSFFIVLYC